MTPERRTIAEETHEYLRELLCRGYSKETVEKRRWYLKGFLSWAMEQGLQYPHQFKRRYLLSYGQYLEKYKRKDNQEPLCLESKRKRFRATALVFAYLHKQGTLPTNPAAKIHLFKGHEESLRKGLSEDLAEAILLQPDLDRPTGIRNRAILETLYSTGIRRMEIANLRLYDLDVAAKVLTIREGKGNKDRLVPIGDRALLWIEQYLSQVRPYLVKGPDNQVLFLGRDGYPLCRSTIGQLVSRYKKEAGIVRIGAAHLFRHTAASLMLENGADIQTIQQFLGHQTLATTQVYAKVNQDKLKEAYLAAHPGGEGE